MKKLVLLFASLCLMATTAFAKEVANTYSEVSTAAPVAAPAEMKPVSKSTENLGDENGKNKLKETKLTTAQKMTLKMMKKPLKKASTDAGVSGGLRTAIIVIAIGLILMILGWVFWPFYLIGVIVLIIGLILLLLELLG